VEILGAERLHRHSRDGPRANDMVWRNISQRIDLTIASREPYLISPSLVLFQITSGPPVL
jgi:hypothetical protein